MYRMNGHKLPYRVAVAAITIWFIGDMAWAIHEDAWSYCTSMTTNTVASMVFYRCVAHLKREQTAEKNRPGEHSPGL